MLQDSETVADITVVPESEMHAHDTDCDSDQSDDEATRDHNRLPSRLLKGEGFLPNSDMQLPNPPNDDPGCSFSVSQTETREVSGTNEKVTSQIVGPMLQKLKNQDRKFKKKSRLQKKHQHKPTKIIRSLVMPKNNLILASHQMIQWISSSHSIPSPSEMPHLKCPISMPTKRENTQPD